ncbi:hypothetical protein CEUSTIGMA_g8130.t1 [Chlamydomonas eustigma]|uniref:Uncharacterized protein n=1 Tax=Chlamydomonas eustigma TaxID=1157962 RepID=A0A250XC79_9CHLO|nr:hypothetical protein CEUSTIGMA_g8130.t1 [Chlamydomonas eustigma]|eukprot:GAX80695.1 hypothetical protein CEUSTIGMA_g8130.t1 [Chlamydomonas eustigma]
MCCTHITCYSYYTSTSRLIPYYVLHSYYLLLLHINFLKQLHLLADAYCSNVAAALAADSAVSSYSEAASASGAAIMDDDGFVSEEAAKVAAALAAGTYKPSALDDPGFEVWAGFIAGVIPFAIGSWEFGKRIIIQQRCKQCSGKGLVPSAKEGAKYMRKCPQCGGFFPWVSWKLFLTSTAAPGNGGPLQFPKGQEGKLFYEVPPLDQEDRAEATNHNPLTQIPASHNPLSTPTSALQGEQHDDHITMSAPSHNAGNIVLSSGSTECCTGHNNSRDESSDNNNSSCTQVAAAVTATPRSGVGALKQQQ